jgi:hypothetical protein
MGLATTLRRLLRGALYALGALLLIALALAYFVMPPRGVFLTDSWQFKEKHDGPVIGDLGGVPVRIPAEFAHFVEYNGDPALLEQRKGSVPERTPRSRLRSFGYEVLYPQMLGLTPQTKTMGYHDNIYLSTWVDVTVNAGERYPGPQALRNQEKALSDPVWWKFPLKQKAERVNDLTVYESQGGDPTNIQHVTVYTHHTPTGDIDAYIDCEDIPHPAARCTLEADMSPDMGVNLRIHFRRGLLPQWAEILKNVKIQILSFKHTP